MYFLSEWQKMQKTSEIKQKEISFEQWNNQFFDNCNLDDFIPEYGTTLREFRYRIYKAEMGEEMNLKEFKENLKTW